MLKRPIELPDLEKRPLKLARWNGRAAVSLLAVAVVSAVVGKASLSASTAWVVAWTVAAWAAFSAAFFWLASNAHAEVTPIRFFVQRAALFVLLLPAGIALLSRLDSGIAERWVLLALAILFFGTSVIRRGS